MTLSDFKSDFFALTIGSYDCDIEIVKIINKRKKNFVCEVKFLNLEEINEEFKQVVRKDYMFLTILIKSHEDILNSEGQIGVLDGEEILKKAKNIKLKKNFEIFYNEEKRN
ncbi:MAG: hypothetical protein ABIP51_20060 [Bacteroidia bacterium]